VARTIRKVLQSAVANAVAVEGKINVEHLHVKQAVAGAGPTMKRIMPRAQGRATPLLKRTSHITIVVEGEAPGEEPAPRRRARPAAKAATPEPKAPATTKKPRRRKAAAATKEA